VSLGAGIPLSPAQVPPVVHEQLDAAQRLALRADVKRLLAEHNAVLVAHYYTDAEIQSLADETGGHVSDSLDMARFGHESDAEVLVVCGVRFMGETAKILNPEKRVLMPTLEATCSLDLGCPADAFSAFCDAHPERTVVVYANTSAAVKARADWMVTSGSALPLVRHLDARGEKILWAPDKYLGSYVQRQSGADMLLWNGACVVHEEFKGGELAELRQRYPAAQVLVHPESPAAVLQQADYIGSTSGMIRAARSRDAATFIVATEQGILHKMRQAAPGKTFLAAPTSGRGATCKSCAYCPWMAMNGLASLTRVLATGDNEIHVPAELCRRALAPIERLLEFSRARGQAIHGQGDA